MRHVSEKGHEASGPPPLPASRPFCSLGCSPSVPCVIDGFDYSDSDAKPNGAGWTLNDQICAWSNVTQACTLTKHTHSGLSPNRGYYYKARAFSA